MDEERKDDGTLESGFIDTFRYFYPDMEQTILRSIVLSAREGKNADDGSIIFCASEEYKEHLVMLHSREVFGPNYCPVELVEVRRTEKYGI